MTQVLANSLVAAGILLAVGFGFALIYHVTGFFHFAHGAVFTAGAYLNLGLVRAFDLPPLPSAALAIAGSSLLGILMELGVYRVLRDRGASPSVLLLASLGLYVSTIALIAMLFGSQVETLSSGDLHTTTCTLGARLTVIQILTLGCGLLVVVVGGLVLRWSKLGTVVRAVADDPWLARVVGVETDRVVLGVFAAGSALAGLAGILFSLDFDLRPTMGMRVLMLSVVAVVLGGKGSTRGLLLGTLVLAVGMNLGGWYLGYQWQDTLALLVLLACLLARPQGFLGKPLRSAEV